jgi:hypothetical protein
LTYRKNVGTNIAGGILLKQYVKKSNWRNWKSKIHLYKWYIYLYKCINVLMEKWSTCWHKEEVSKVQESCQRFIRIIILKNGNNVELNIMDSKQCKYVL